jgi:hypothetical protein
VLVGHLHRSRVWRDFSHDVLISEVKKLGMIAELLVLGLRLAAWWIYSGRREGSLWLSKKIAFRRSGDSNSWILSRSDQMTRTLLQWQRI